MAYSLSNTEYRVSYGRVVDSAAHDADAQQRAAVVTNGQHQEPYSDYWRRPYDPHSCHCNSPQTAEGKLAALSWGRNNPTRATPLMISPPLSESVELMLGERYGSESPPLLCERPPLLLESLPPPTGPASGAETRCDAAAAQPDEVSPADGVASADGVTSAAGDGEGGKQAPPNARLALDVNPLAVRLYNGPPPHDAAFRDFINHRWAEGKRLHNAEYMFVTRHFHSTAALEHALSTGARGGDLTNDSVDLALPVFCCYTVRGVHFTVEYWGHPADHPRVTATTLGEPPGVGGGAAP